MSNNNLNNLELNHNAVEGLYDSSNKRSNIDTNTLDNTVALNPPKKLKLTHNTVQGPLDDNGSSNSQAIDDSSEESMMVDETINCRPITLDNAPNFTYHDWSDPLTIHDVIAILNAQTSGCCKRGCTNHSAHDEFINPYSIVLDNKPPIFNYWLLQNYCAKDLLKQKMMDEKNK